MNSSIILTYKNKILLFSKEVILNPSENKWDFFRVTNNKKSKLIDALKKEMNLSSNVNNQELPLIPLAGEEDSSSVFYTRMTDENVNSISRKKGWRLEFYRIDELDKITLSDDASSIFEEYKDQIIQALSE